MAYLEPISLHAHPVDNGVKPLPPAAILFPHGPEWSWRFQRNQLFDKLDNRFMYKDQGPPLYRKLGAHYNMYKIPNRTEYSVYSKSYHYEPRQYNSPSYQNGAVAFPPGPPPAQVAEFEGRELHASQKEPKVRYLHMPNITGRSLKDYDQYRYLPGPPSETQVYGCPQAWRTKLPSL